ncbi:hypothetical protein [Lysinibacillus fusiformis]|uniref:hypothetical protein n=1 Tax=Lysinibacillus fusiformis TaxID=28031 RepID=UPI003D0284A2
MILSERVKDTDIKAYFFVKFMEKKYVDRFKEGYVHMKNLKAYVDMEKDKQKVGVGDKYEGSLVLKGGQLKVYNEADEHLFDLETEEVTLTHEQDLLHPVFCSYVIDMDNLKIIDETNDYVTTNIAMSDEELEKIIEEFPDTAVFISASEFYNRFLAACKNKGYDLDAEKVKYYDYLINQKDRVATFLTDPLVKKAFIKSDYFQHQNEFRFIITNKEIYEPLDDFNIGDISDIAFEMKTDEILKFKTRFKKDTSK